MIKALLKNSPTSDLDEIRQAVDTLIHEMLSGDKKPQVPVIQINQAAYSDLRCYIDEFALDALAQEGYMIVGEVMPQEELEELFDSIEIPDRPDHEPYPALVKCGNCGLNRRWTKYNDKDSPHYIPCCECDEATEESND